MSLENILEQLPNDRKVNFVFEEIKLHFACQLKKIMDEKKINKKELAEKLGVKPSYVSKIFGGDNISLKVIAKVLVALNVDPIIEIQDFNKVNQENIDWKAIEFPVIQGEYDESENIQPSAT